MKALGFSKPVQAAICGVLLAACAAPYIVAARAVENGPSVKIVALGDSLTAGYMLPQAAGFPAQLQVALQKKGYKVEVINAGVSGDTTSGGLQRLDWALGENPDGVILELGANDGLRGIDPRIARGNLDKIISSIAAKKADILLAGIRAVGNWGPEYETKFNAIFPELAAKHAVPLYPFFLEGVIGEKSLVLDDGLHPNEKGVAEIVKRILPEAEALVKRISARKAAAVK